MAGGEKGPPRFETGICPAGTGLVLRSDSLPPSSSSPLSLVYALCGFSRCSRFLRQRLRERRWLRRISAFICLGRTRSTRKRSSTPPICASSWSISGLSFLVVTLPPSSKFHSYIYMLIPTSPLSHSFAANHPRIYEKNFDFDCHD